MVPTVPAVDCPHCPPPATVPRAPLPAPCSVSAFIHRGAETQPLGFPVEESRGCGSPADLDWLGG